MGMITLTMQDGSESKPFDESKLSKVLTELAKTAHKVTGINRKDPNLTAPKPVDPAVQAGKQYSQNVNLESPIGSLVNGLAQGVTMGGLDEGGAGVRTAMQVVPDAFGWLLKNGMDTQIPVDEAKKEISNTFDQQLAMERAKRDRARNANPLTYDAGDLLGGLAASAISGKGAPVVNAGSVEGHSDDKASMATAAQALLAGGLTKAGSVAGSAIGAKLGNLKTLIDNGGITGKVLKMVLDHSGIPISGATGIIAKLSPQLGNVIGSAIGPGEELANTPLTLTDDQKDELYKVLANAS